MLKRLLVAGLVAGVGHPALAQNTAPAAPAQGGFLTKAPPGAIRLSKLRGTDVIGSDITTIGEVEDVLVGADGRAQGVLIGVGGFLGMGGKTVAVPFEAMLWNTEARPTDGPSSSNTGPGLQMQMAPANDPASPGVNTAGGDPARTGSVTGSSGPGGMGLGATSPGVGGATAAGGAGPLTPMAQGTGSETASRTGMEAAMGGAAPAAPATVQVGGDRSPQRAVLRVTKEELRNAPEFNGLR